MTETKISIATMPTKNAAISSIPSMKRSIALRLRGAGDGAVTIEASAAVMTWRVPSQRNGGDPPRRHRHPIASRSICRLVFGQHRLEVLHHGIRIAATLLHPVGPRGDHRLGRLLPLGELCVGQRVDLMAFVLELLDAGVLEI